MEPKSDAPQNAKQLLHEPVQHIEGAYSLLKALDERIGHLQRYPELKEAITKLEFALNAITLNTSGLL
jgi:hypothetical protein